MRMSQSRSYGRHEVSGRDRDIYWNKIYTAASENAPKFGYRCDTLMRACSRPQSAISADGV